jgi:type I restriction enzyme M protein
VLFIDARNAADSRISRTQVEFTDSQLKDIAMLYHRWRGTEFSDGEAYQDQPGLVFSAALADIEKHDFVLTPGRYVGAADVEEDSEPFAEKMQRLTAQLGEQFKESERLEAEIKTNLAGLGYAL